MELFTCHNINKIKCFKVKLQHREYDHIKKTHWPNSSEQHMKQFTMWAYVIVSSKKNKKSQTSCFKREQVVPTSKSAGMKLCFLFFSSALYSCGLSSLKGLVLQVFLAALPTSELHYYQQSAFKSAPAQHQDVFCMLILRDTDPSLLCRSLMPGVPETAGKTVSDWWAVHTVGISGHHSTPQLKSTLQHSVLCAAEKQNRFL